MRFFSAISFGLLTVGALFTGALPVPGGKTHDLRTLPDELKVSRDIQQGGKSLPPNLKHFWRYQSKDWYKNIVEIDHNCDNHKPAIVSALTEAYTIAESVVGVSPNDQLFNVFFHRREFGDVLNVFKAITNTSASASGPKYRISCSTPLEPDSIFSRECAVNYTQATRFQRGSNKIEDIHLCHNTLVASNATKISVVVKGETKFVDPSLSHILLRMLTGLGVFASFPAEKPPGDTWYSTGTRDIWRQSMPDENRPGKTYMDAYSSGETAAVCLKKRWDAYNKQQQKTGGTGPASKALRQPSFWTRRNAESYASFAFAYFGFNTPGVLDDAQKHQGLKELMAPPECVL